MLFFKGYVETKDKKCIEKFKNRTDFKTFEQVQSLPEYAGILAKDTILVDIDDFEIKIKKIINKELPSLVEEGYKVAKSRDIKKIGKELKEVYEEVMKM